MPVMSLSTALAMPLRSLQGIGGIPHKSETTVRCLPVAGRPRLALGLSIGLENLPT